MPEHFPLMPVGDPRWGDGVSCPDHCLHPVAIRVGRASGNWERRLAQRLQELGLLHWKITRDPYLAWIPQNASAMIVIRQVDATESLDRLTDELNLVTNHPSHGLLFVLPPERAAWRWHLSEAGAVDVQLLQIQHVDSVARMAQQFLLQAGRPHSDRTVPACWLARRSLAPSPQTEINHDHDL